MSSNRLTYDKCAYAETIKESTGSLEYNLFMGKYEKCEKCPISAFANTIPFPSLADVESELWGLTRPGTLCSKGINTAYIGEALSPARMCESIHYITPNNLEKPKTNMLNEQKIKELVTSDYCNITNIKEGFSNIKCETPIDEKGVLFKGRKLADAILNCHQNGRGATPQLTGHQISGDVVNCNKIQIKQNIESNKKNKNKNLFENSQICCDNRCSKYAKEDIWLNQPCKDFCKSETNLNAINPQRDAMKFMTDYFNKDPELKNTLSETKIEGCKQKIRYAIDVVQVTKGEKTKKSLQGSETC